MNQILDLLQNEPDLVKINESIDPFVGFKKSKMGH